jgi:PAT family beta-lactamase induction signal transducer AmpG
MGQSLSITSSQQTKINQILSTPSLLSVFFFGFASGLPLLLTGSTLQAWYAVSDINIVTIGILTLVGQPYVYKFLWAPLLDRFNVRQMGRRRSWIFILQFLLVVGIACIGLLRPDKNPLTLASVALFVAFCSATQDIAIDAYRAEILSPQNHGLGAGLSTIAYRIAMLIAGAVALCMADRIGWQYTYWSMALLMALHLLVTFFSQEPPIKDTPTSTLFETYIEPFRIFFKKKYAFSVLLFVFVYKLGDVFTLVLGTTFLIRGIGFSLTDIGLLYKLVGMLGIFLGAIVGGWWIKKMSLLRGLLIFGIIQAVTNLPFMGLAICGKNYGLLVITILIENFGSGLGSVAFMAFIMGLCDRHYTATHFALLSALAAIGRVFVGPFAGIMVEHIGWTQYYLVAFLMGFPGIVMLAWIKRHQVFLGMWAT